MMSKPGQTSQGKNKLRDLLILGSTWSDNKGLPEQNTIADIDIFYKK